MSNRIVVHHNRQIDEWIRKLNHDEAKAICIIGVKKDMRPIVYMIDEFSHEDMGKQLQSISFEMLNQKKG